MKIFVVLSDFGEPMKGAFKNKAAAMAFAEEFINRIYNSQPWPYHEKIDNCFWNFGTFYVGVEEVDLQ